MRKNDTIYACVSRLLVFSPSKMEVVRVKIDKDDWIECQNVEGPLFVGKWDPAKYSVGLHEIKVSKNIDKSW